MSQVVGKIGGLQANLNMCVVWRRRNKVRDVHYHPPTVCIQRMKATELSFQGRHTMKLTNELVSVAPAISPGSSSY